MGEFNTAKPLLKELKKDFAILLTYFSPRAKDYLRKQRSYYDLLHVLPLDLPPLVKRFEKIVEPVALIVLEREFWPSLLSFTSTKKALVNTYAKESLLERLMSKRFSLIITRTQEDAKRFKSYGAKRVLPCGNLKFVMDVSQKDISLKSEGRFFVAGSTHRGEEDLVIRVFLRLKKDIRDLKLILAPRHMHRVEEIKRLLTGLNYSLRSQEVPGWDILLVDTLGELFHLYSVGDVCFVGGTFVNVGGHNLLEPAYWKKPVLFGPYTYKVRDMEEFLMQRGIGFKVWSEEEFYHVSKKLLKEGFYTDFNLSTYSQAVRKCYLDALRGFTDIP